MTDHHAVPTESKKAYFSRGVFSPQSMYIGVMIGGPFVVGWLLGENYKTFGKRKLGMLFQIIGVASTTVLITCSLILRQGFLFAFILQMVALLCFVKYQERDAEIYIEHGGRERLVWPLYCIIFTALLWTVFFPVTYVRNRDFAFEITTGHSQRVVETDRIGVTLYGGRKYPGAISSFNKSIALDPKDAIAYVFRGRSESFGKDGSGDVAAIADFTNALTLKHNTTYDRTAYYFRGGVYANQKKYAEALSDLTSALYSPQSPKSLPEDAAISDEEIYLSRAAVYFVIKNNDAAFADILAAVAIDPDYHGAQIYKAIMENVRGDLAAACADATAGHVDRSYALNMTAIKADLIKRSCVKK